MKLLKLFKTKPSTLKEFIDRRKFLQTLILNTDDLKNKRMLQTILEENKKIKGFEFPDLAKRRKDIMGDEGKAAKDFEMKLQEILAKHSTKHATGGRVPLGGGKLVVKGGNWLIKSLLGTREQIKTLRLSPGQLKEYLNQIDDQIRRIKAGEKIPDEVIQTIRKDPKFKSVWQNQKSLDPDLREMEEVLLEYGQKHATGGRVSLSAGGLAGMLGE